MAARKKQATAMMAAQKTAAAASAQKQALPVVGGWKAALGNRPSSPELKERPRTAAPKLTTALSSTAAEAAMIPDEELFDANGRLLGASRIKAAPVEIPTAPTAKAQVAVMNQQSELGKINSRILQAINSFEDDDLSPEDRGSRWGELRNAIDSLLTGSSKRVVSRKMMMAALSDSGRGRRDLDEEALKETEIPESSLDELAGAVEQTHTKMARLGELENDQHGMVMALRGQLADVERDLRRQHVETRSMADAAEKHKQEMAQLRVQLKQTEEKYVAEKKARDAERAEARALARNQAEIDALTNRLSQLQRETSSEIALLRETNHRVSHECTELSRQLNEAQRKLQATSEALEAKTNEHEALLAEAGKGVAKEELEELEAEKARQLEELRAAHQGEMRAAVLEALEKQEELEKLLEAAHAQLRLAEEDANELRQKVLDARDRLVPTVTRRRYVLWRTPAPHLGRQPQLLNLTPRPASPAAQPAAQLEPPALAARPAGGCRHYYYARLPRYSVSATFCYPTYCDVA